MISRVAGAALLACGLSLAPVLPTGPASAGGSATVNVVNMSFSPASLTVPLGATVTWNFQDMTTHDTSSKGRFWASGPKSSGDSFSYTFVASGSYAYLCTIHPSMTGVVKVPVKASGTPTRGWRLRWAIEAGGADVSFDVQVRKPGSSTWTPFRTDTTKAATKFNPHNDGTYAVRARITVGIHQTGWSPVRSLKIT
jgi:plastocyanin